MHAPPLFKTIALFFLLVLNQCVSAQKKLQRNDSLVYYREIEFIQEASAIVNNATKNEDWIPLQHFAENWQHSAVPSDELILAITTLLAINSNHFSLQQLPCDFMLLLEDYAKELNQVDAGSPAFKYRIQLSNKYWYDATNDVKKLLPVVRSWASHIRASHSLSKTELFFCSVFAGEIFHPRSATRLSSIDYPDLTAFQQALETSNQSFFAARRNGRIGTAGIMLGSWLPTGNLGTLGIHPSVGVSVGIRNKMNEYDVIWNFRFLHPTPQSYNVMRGDSIFSTNYYDGGYAGLDYTRYIIHKTRYELGLVLGIGYDYFSIASGFNSSDADPKLLPLNVGSFDVSSGARFKYFLSPKSYIGIVAKYHLVNYCNQGGTDLGGHAFTIDLLFGSHKPVLFVLGMKKG